MLDNLPSGEHAVDTVVQRHVPLKLRWDVADFRPILKDRFGVKEAGAAIILELYAEHLGSGRPISYSRRQSHYEAIPERYRHPLYGFKRIRSAVDHLDGLGLILHDKAPCGRRGWQSSMRAGTTLIAALDSILDGGLRMHPARPIEAIILRDGNGVLQDYLDTQELDCMRWRMKEVNEALAVTNVSSCLVQINDRASVLRRIFNRSFDRGGRWYAESVAWQHMPKPQRRCLTINGEAVIELDYAALHPSLLYAQIGCSPPDDIYDIGSWPRRLVKKGLLILINSRTLRQARDALAHDPAMGAVSSPGSKDANTQAAALILAVRQKHSRIAAFFHSDAGAKLMRTDSDMAEHVIISMLSHGVVVLPVHDSFLVARSKAAQLAGAMVEAADRKGMRHARITGNDDW